MSDSFRPCGLQPTRLLRPWDSPGKDTGVGCHFLLQGIFLTQGSNPCLPHCRQTLYRLSRQGSPKYLLMTLLMLLAILFEFSLFYQVTVSCITRCMTEPQIKVIMTRELKTIDQIYSSVIRSRIVTVEVYIRG